MKRRVWSLVLPIAMSGAVAMADGGEPPAAKPPTPPAATSPQDVVVLKDGRRLEGEIVGEDDRAVSLKSGGVTRTYMKDSIASIEKAPRTAAPSDPSGRPGAAPATPPAPTDPAKGKKGAKGERRDAPLSDAGKKWLDDLIAKSADAGDDSVRRSIAQAIQALGPSAIAAVRAAQAAAPEGPQKQFLDRVATDMEQRRDRRDGPDGGPGRPAQGRRQLDEFMQRLTTEAELKDDQKPKVEAVLQDWGKKRGELFLSARRDGLSQEQLQEKAAALRADLFAQMKTVLTEPQDAVFEEMANKMFEAQRAGAPGKQPAKPADPPKPDGGDQPMQPPEPAK